MDVQEKTIGDAITFCQYNKRRTVTSLDVVHALRKSGNTIYGYKGNVVVSHWIQEKTDNLTLSVSTDLVKMISKYYGPLCDTV